MQYDSFLELVKSRRSVHHYKPDPVDDADIEKIIEAARWAPSGFNSQLWEFVVIKNPHLRQQIARIIGEARLNILKGKTPDQDVKTDSDRRVAVGWQKAPVFILVFGDTRVRSFSHVPPIRNNDEQWNSVFNSSLATAFQQAALAAVCLGLGSQWMSAVKIPHVEAKLKEILGIPESLKIFDMLVLGYPRLDPGPKCMRTVSEMIHYDQCGIDDFRSDERVRAYFIR